MHACSRGSILLIVVVLTAVYTLFIIQSWRITSTVVSASHALERSTEQQLLMEGLMYYAIAWYSAHQPLKHKDTQQLTINPWPPKNPATNSVNNSSINKRHPAITYQAKIFYSPSKGDCTIQAGLYQENKCIISGTCSFLPTSMLQIQSWHIHR